MNTREDNIQSLFNLLSAEKFAKILDINYSDEVIDYISSYAPTAEKFADTRYRPETVEKLFGLMEDCKIDTYDMMELMEDSLSYNRNEQYVDKFVETITVENRHDVYAVFRTTNVTDVSFDDMYLGIHQGAYEATSLGVVQMNRDLAKEMHDLGIRLMVCEGYDHYSDLIDFDQAYDEDTYTFVAVQRHRLASAVNDVFRQPDWSGFKDYLKAQMGGSMDKLTPYILSDMQKKYYVELSMNRLADKVSDEYDRFIADIKRQPPERIVEAAYEIVQKDDIREYCSGTDHLLSQEQLDDLLSADALLDRLYNKWDELTDVHSLYDMDVMLEETASDLKEERLEREAAKEDKAVEQSEKAAPPKPTKHTRR